MSAVIAIKSATRFSPTAPKFEVSCASCNLRELCLPGALCMEDLERVENIVYARRRVKRGEALFNAGAEFNAIYAIRSGFFKSSVLDARAASRSPASSWWASCCGLDGLGSAATTAARSRSRTARCACCPTR
jgi:CRP/FNR family transcriptional regulator